MFGQGKQSNNRVQKTMLTSPNKRCIFGLNTLEITKQGKAVSDGHLTVKDSFYRISLCKLIK